ncbi:MAG TPA: CehA/McbA family metallohydrolase [Kineosporiaceae bacterium]
MRAFVLTGPGDGAVHDVPAPVAAPGEAVVDVVTVPFVCGFTGPWYLEGMVTGAGSALEVVVRDRVFGAGGYRYLPFEVPPGVGRITVGLEADRPVLLGLGLFDARGSGHGSPGFRGISGTERREVVVGLREATPGFLPGPVPPGRWTVIVPVFLAAVPARIRVRIRMERGRPDEPSGPGPSPGRLPGAVRTTPGWYRGDLHCHTEASSDAWATGAALTPAGWADLARGLGLDFLAMTDHNVVSQNHQLARDAGEGVLLLAGEEVTSYFHGHATVSGVEPDDWFDFRLSPFGLPLPSRGARIETLLDGVRASGGFVAAAHPMMPFLSWQFLADGLARPSARPDALEVWNGRWQVHNELAVRVWHRLLCRGWRIAATGGSDLHGTLAPAGLGPGVPTTVVHAAALERGRLVEALRAGRCFITSRPDGPELYLTAAGPGGQQTFTGGTLHAHPGDVVQVRVLARRAGGMRLTVLNRRGPCVSVGPASDEETVEVPLTVGTTDDFVRVELRRAATSWLPGPPPMEALTNPIHLTLGGPVAATPPELAPPAPAR